MGDKVTVPEVRSRKGGQKLAMVTAYDYPSARMASEAGVDIILVGDSVANVIHGMEDTLGVDIDIMVMHARAVGRADPDPLVVVDMPWLTFHISREDTLRNAGRLVREGGAEAVKVEGGHKRIPMIEALVGAEIPVMGHLGLTPQSVHAMGGYRVQGRELEAARLLVQEAKELEAAGVFSIVLEGVPDVVAKMVTEQVSVPTIGIGAGAHCDGQVLVWTDLLGLGFGRYPKFVRRYEDFAERGVAAMTAYVRDVRSGAFPGEEESYHLSEEVAAELEGRPASVTATPRISPSTSDTSTTISSGDLAHPDVRSVEVDGRSLLVAWADSADERQRGLMEVEDLGGLDGMMFEFESERRVSFTMRNTLIPLDIYFFDSDGEAVGMLEMVPCESDPCPSYPADEPVRYALEVPAGHLSSGSAPELVIP